MKTTLARFPFVTTLAQVDVADQPSVHERQIKAVATLRCVAQAEDEQLIGRFPA